MPKQLGGGAGRKIYEFTGIIVIKPRGRTLYPGFRFSIMELNQFLLVSRSVCERGLNKTASFIC